MFTMNPKLIPTILTAALALSLSACAKKDAPLSLEQKLEGPLRNAELLSVTKEYGPLVLSAQEIAEASRPCSETNSDCNLSRDAVREDGTPWVGWSAYWLPFTDDYLFASADPKVVPPLKKYDQYVAKSRNSTPSRAAELEATSLVNYDPGRAQWEGRCHSWALASLMELPPRAIPELGMTEGDLRSLIVKTYEMYEVDTPNGVRVFGVNQQKRDADIRDILPDQLLRFAQAELFERGRPFIIDADKDLEVWNQPVWGVDLFLERDPAEANALVGRMWFRGAAKLGRSKRDHSYKKTDPWTGRQYYSDTDSYDQSNIEFEFRLKGRWNADGSFEAQDSEWLGQSVTQHPDFVVRIPTGPIEHGSRNNEIRNDVVAELLARSRK